MLDIAFLTTSRIKIAHAKHLCKSYNINVFSYRQLYYGISYIEPRILDRNELLRRSVEDATSRWKKYRNLTTTTNLFILEDTSVTINALSKEGLEVPGVDVKYWMRENTFESVDKLLKDLGNDRSVRVNSHLILYLTHDLQKRLGQEYLVFTSFTEGHITSEQYEIKTQPMYPWLDGKTFNKWFVPNGYDIPISMLPIEEADKVDFRKGAFNEMIELLSDLKLAHKAVVKVPDWKIGLDSFIVICGPTCAGKTTGAKYLNFYHEFYHIEASDFMYLNYYEKHGTSSDISIAIFAKDALTNNPNIVVDRIITHISEIGNLPIVVTGFRSPLEVINFQTKLALDNNYKLIYLDAEKEIRYKRWVERKRDVQPLTIEEFTANNAIQDEIGLSDIKKLECIKLYNNFQNKDDFFQYLTNELNLLDSKEFNIEWKLARISKNNTLEELILFTLLHEYLHNDEYEYFTTTKISHMIFSLFKIKKHKDNVSRYFNQKYYPYYELKGEKDKLLIRLSPTGVSKSLLLLNKIS